MISRPLRRISPEMTAAPLVGLDGIAQEAARLGDGVDVAEVHVGAGHRGQRVAAESAQAVAVEVPQALGRAWPRRSRRRPRRSASRSTPPGSGSWKAANPPPSPAAPSDRSLGSLRLRAMICGADQWRPSVEVGHVEGGGPAGEPPDGEAARCVLGDRVVGVAEVAVGGDPAARRPTGWPFTMRWTNSGPEYVFWYMQPHAAGTADEARVALAVDLGHRPARGAVDVAGAVVLADEDVAR